MECEANNLRKKMASVWVYLTLLHICAAATPDEVDNIMKMITAVNYPIEKYTVQTSDNYLLALYRIPASPKTAPKSNREVVMLIHGLLMSSADYLVLGPQKALAYKLADAGFDVWLGNTRGNTWSRNHENHSPDGKEFWNFSFHELAIYDIPPMIEFALKKAGTTKLHLIGHSQGSTAIVAMLSELPAYNEKVQSAFLLAPAMYVSHPSPLVEFFAINSKPLSNAMDTFGFYEIFPWRQMMLSAANMLCATNLDTHVICRDACFALYGRSPEQYNASTFLAVMENTPAGGSLKSFEHFTQLVKARTFQKYDYSEMNEKMYGQKTPPAYDLMRIATKLHVFYGVHDIVITKEDALLSIQKLGDAVASSSAVDGFNHVDFMWGNTADKMIYDKIIAKLHEH